MAWPTTGVDNDAVFANTAGTVTVATGGVTVNDITLSTAAYIIQSNSITCNGTAADPGAFIHLKVEEAP